MEMHVCVCYAHIDQVGWGGGGLWSECKIDQADLTDWMPFIQKPTVKLLKVAEKLK